MNVAGVPAVLSCDLYVAPFTVVANLGDHAVVGRNDRDALPPVGEDVNAVMLPGAVVPAGAKAVDRSSGTNDWEDNVASHPDPPNAVRGLSRPSHRGGPHRGCKEND